MRRSIATVSMSGTLRQKLQAIAAARFDGIELFEADFVNFDGSAADLRRDGRRTSGCRSTCTSRSATSRACPTPTTRAISIAPSASSI